MSVSTRITCKPKVSIRAQLRNCTGIVHLEFEHSESRYNEGFTVNITSAWFNLVLLPDEVCAAIGGVKKGSLNLLSTPVGNELLSLVQKGVYKMNLMLDAITEESKG